MRLRVFCQIAYQRDSKNELLLAQADKINPYPVQGLKYHFGFLIFQFPLAGLEKVISRIDNDGIFPARFGN
jgi:hypothetical protein